MHFWRQQHQNKFNVFATVYNASKRHYALPQETIENVSQFENEIHSLIDPRRSFMRKKKTLIQKGEGFLSLLLGPVLEGLAELVLK